MLALITEKGKKFFFRGSDLHTQHGFIKKEIIEKAKIGDKIVTNTGKEMTLIEANFMDLYKKIKRGAQIIPLKDIGPIITETGINSKSIVLEAGSGSGALCTMLANIVKKVYTYELREDFYKIVKQNIEMFGQKNVVQKIADIYEGIKEKNIDVIILDLPEPWNVIKHAKIALVNGGYLVSYSPTLPQVSDFVEEIRRTEGFIYMKTIEITEREWEVDKRKIRPFSQAIGHSGFLSFVRKVF